MAKKPAMKVDGVFTCELSVDKKSADLHLYGAIGQDFWGDGVDPTEFVQTVDGLDVDELNVFVNSPGGDAFGGIAMMNALRRQKAAVNVTVDGLAASAASYVAMGGDTLTMGRNSQMMIHDASGVCVGKAADMDKMSEMLSKVSDSVAAVYAEKAGGAVSDWRDVMRAETWYTADEAVEAGLADSVDDSQTASATDQFDMHIFNFAGRQNAPAPDFPGPMARVAAATSPAEPETNHEREAEMAFIDEVRARLGTPDADEAGILAALDTMSKRRDIPDGVVTIDQTKLDELKDAAARGAEAIAAQDAERREQIVDKAISDGKIPPARRDYWLTSLSADEEGFTAALDRLKPVIPTEPIGYTGGVDEAGDEADRIYAKAWGNSEKEAR
ncbi:head maturation protease, ClpP-related [Acidipropionibacterium acidipropionici]|uniref:head maturation protease, ClpP-related n=1 Tax=Acidipropionibacterium acidipropionici TaxID=1748 RepID=UPI0013141549|nr:head maturation protease, ClpP-related [Acidipropionibacterium acidipropionici]